MSKFTGLITKHGNSATMEERMKRFKVPGISVAFINEGKFKWARTWGVANTDSQGSLTTHDLMYACSMTKFITAMTVLALAQTGAVNLDEDVNKMLTSWQVPCNHNKVTLRLLLGHQAGIIDGEDSFTALGPGQDYPPLKQILEGKTPVNTKALAIEKQPGSTFAYSDNGYCLVQLVLEDMTGSPLAQLVRDYVFKPLGLQASFIEQPLSREREARASVGHESDGSVTPGCYPVYPFPAPAGLWCTPWDLALALVEVHNALRDKGQVLRRQWAEAMVIPHNLPGIGLGNFSQGKGQSSHIYHLGWGQGFQCAFVFWPWRGTGAVIMTNSQPGMAQNESIVGEIVRGLARDYNWEPVTDMLV